MKIEYRNKTQKEIEEEINNFIASLSKEITITVIDKKTGKELHRLKTVMPREDIIIAI